jgi:hypothetical protein
MRDETRFPAQRFVVLEDGQDPEGHATLAWIMHECCGEAFETEARRAGSAENNGPAL